MKIEAVDLFYVSMPEVLDIGDGSQDALLVRVQAGGEEGWGECEASPLPSIASFVTPMSHSACQPIAASVLEGSSSTDARNSRCSYTRWYVSIPSSHIHHLLTASFSRGRLRNAVFSRASASTHIVQPVAHPGHTLCVPLSSHTRPL